MLLNTILYLGAFVSACRAQTQYYPSIIPANLTPKVNLTAVWGSYIINRNNSGTEIPLSSKNFAPLRLKRSSYRISSIYLPTKPLTELCQKSMRVPTAS